MRIGPLEYCRPQTVEEALALLEERNPDAKVLGGGSDLVARLKLGVASPKRVVDVTGIPGLKYIHEDAGAIAIGAATPLRAVEDSPLVRGKLPSLAEAAGSVASFQIRNIATLAGNLCLETMCWYFNQSRQWRRSRLACHKTGGKFCHAVRNSEICYATYRGDTATPLIALGAEVTVRSARGHRSLPLEELFTGDGSAPFSLSPAELVAELRIPLPKPASGDAYFRISHRNAVDYPQAAVAAAIGLAPGNGRCLDVRIVLGATGSKPIRAVQAEALVRGEEVTAELLAHAAETAAGEARPVNNMTFGSPAYRRRMVRTLGQKALNAAVESARRP